METNNINPLSSIQKMLAEEISSGQAPASVNTLYNDLLSLQKANAFSLFTNWQSGETSQEAISRVQNALAKVEADLKALPQQDPRFAPISDLVSEMKSTFESAESKDIIPINEAYRQWHTNESSFTQDDIDAINNLIAAKKRGDTGAVQKICAENKNANAVNTLIDSGYFPDITDWTDDSQYTQVEQDFNPHANDLATANNSFMNDFNNLLNDVTDWHNS